jgi:ABC-type sulfate/molybdate transport systems ATPase subunit
VSGSVVENIALGRSGATFHEVVAAARRAHADDFIRALPHGYDTLLGEDGVGLSGGQQRRIALARAVLRDAPLLLLDEPTAGLDGTSARQVRASIQAVAHGRTVVAVTHDRVLALCADLVVVLDDGSVAEIGAPATLLSADGPFTRLWGIAHCLDNQHQGECSHEQGIGMLGPLRRRPRWVGQVRQVEEVPQVPQVEQVAQVGRLLTAGPGGGHVAVASPARVTVGRQR